MAANERAQDLVPAEVHDGAVEWVVLVSQVRIVAVPVTLRELQDAKRRVCAHR